MITAVQRRRGPSARTVLWVDGERRIELLHATVERHGLRVGRILDPAELDAIVMSDARRATLEAAARLVARRPHAERELRTKLRRRRATPAHIDEAIALLAKAGAIDDASFARTFAEMRDRTSPRGRRLIVAELRARGVDAESARSAAAGVAEEDAAYRFASRRARSLRADDFPSFRDRLGAQLQRRGFSWEVARRTVERCWHERTSQESDEPIE